MSAIVNKKVYANEKNAQIARTRQETRKRRSQQTCRVYELKVDMDKLNLKQKEALNKVFLEAKWIYNAALNTDKPTSYIPGKTVPVMNREGKMEDRNICYLGSQLKQSIVSSISRNLYSLKALKEKGHKVGSLRFARKVQSIDLKQYKTTYKINFLEKKASIQKIPGSFKVYGLHQIPQDAELANAKLIKKASGFFIKITAYTSQVDVDDFIPNTAVGIDMGVTTHITLSTGEKISTTIEVPQRVKRLQRKLDRQYRQAKKRKNQEGLSYIPLSHNYFITKKKLNKKYNKLNNKKDNLAKQIVSLLMKNEYVFFQDESLNAWKMRFGRKLHHSVLGRVKSLLKAHPRAFMVDKWSSTTQWCSLCGENTKHSLKEREYVCKYCGATEDRDIHAAKNMIDFGLSEHNIPMEHRELTPVLIGQNSYLDQLDYVFYKHSERVVDLQKPVAMQGTVSSMKQETNSSLVSW